MEILGSGARRLGDLKFAKKGARRGSKHQKEKTWPKKRKKRNQRGKVGSKREHHTPFRKGGGTGEITFYFPRPPRGCQK